VSGKDRLHEDLVLDTCLVMAAAVERDVDRVSKWSHLVRLS